MFSVRQRCFVEPSIYVCVCGAFGVVGARISVALRWTAGASGSIVSRLMLGSASTTAAGVAGAGAGAMVMVICESRAGGGVERPDLAWWGLPLHACIGTVGTGGLHVFDVVIGSDGRDVILPRHHFESEGQGGIYVALADCDGVPCPPGCKKSA